MLLTQIDYFTLNPKPVTMAKRLKRPKAVILKVLISSIEMLHSKISVLLKFKKISKSQGLIVL